MYYTYLHTPHTVRKLDLETYTKPYNERAGHHVLGLLAAADLS
jgi:hypothetical protein